MRVWMNLALTFWVCSVMVGWSVPVAAQAVPQPAPQQQAAAGHFERGVELYREGSLDAALVEFERAYEAVPDYRVLYNLAQVQSQRGEYVEAMALFEKYLDEGKDAVAPARKAEVEQDLSKLQRRVAKLWVDSNVAGAELFVNERLVGTLPLSQPVTINSGVCDVRVVKPGFEPRTQRIKVAGGEQPRVSLPLSVLRPDQNAPLDTTSASSANQVNPNYTPFWVSFAAAAVFGGASAGLGYLAYDSKSKMNDELARIPADRDLAREHSKDIQRFSLWGDISGAAAVLAAGSALYFLISPPNSAVKSEGRVVSSLELRASGTSAVLSGTF